MGIAAFLCSLFSFPPFSLSSSATSPHEHTSLPAPWFRSQRELTVPIARPTTINNHMPLASPNRKKTAGNQKYTEPTSRCRGARSATPGQPKSRQPGGARTESQGGQETSPTGSGPWCEEGRRRKKDEIGKRRERKIRRLTFGRNFRPPWAFGTFPTNVPISATSSPPQLARGNKEE